MERYHGIVTGRVQGVGFRYMTQQFAVELGLSGWVKNQSDGSVEFEVQGNKTEIEPFLVKVKKGRFPAKVTELKLSQIPLEENYSSFKVIN
ncbi:acylphosphatase [Evansella tamaricis]|uniref:Acylphosphatase n=1 Tax=Evansella tamaricis TaxID=2069301 RepID=A0ABS6J9W7_9BACI|nr:acylphosphatase [Evansella tamaricis]MBU9710336.1 acylphosphatase [Evansella tamaricis]